VKKHLKVLKPFNNQFVIDGGNECIDLGEEAICGYNMIYNFIEREKKIEEKIDDITFLDRVNGK
jgi:hypothetical protein